MELNANPRLASKPTRDGLEYEPAIRWESLGSPKLAVSAFVVVQELAGAEEEGGGAITGAALTLTYSLFIAVSFRQPFCTRSKMTSLLKKSTSKLGSRNLDEPSTPEEEQSKINDLRAAIGTLTGRLEQFADDACLRRYLRARNWNLKKSEKMLKDTLAWRESYKPEDIRWSDIAGESETGKIYRANFKDKKGHTVLVMHPGRQNTSSGAQQIKQLVYFLENAVLNLAEGQEQMIWMIDYKGWSMKKNTPLSIARETANILQNHYPERLYVAILYNPPRLFEAFWRLVKPFLDPKTFRKVKFVYTKNADSQKILAELFEEDAVKSTFENLNDYTHEDYAKLMQEDDLKSSLHWKGAGETKPEQAEEVQKGIVPVPDVGNSKTEVTPAPVAAAPVAEASPAAAAPVAEASIAGASPEATASIAKDSPAAAAPAAAAPVEGASPAAAAVPEAAASVAEVSPVEAPPVAAASVADASPAEAAPVAEARVIENSPGAPVAVPIGAPQS